MLARRMVALDIGNDSVKAAVAGRVVDRRLPENAVSGGEAVSPETLAAFLSRMRKEERLPRDAAIVLDSSQVHFRHVALPEMSADELVLNLPYEFRDFISGDPDEYVFDYMSDGPASDGRLELFAAATRRELVETYGTALRKAGFRMRACVPAQAVYSRIVDQVSAPGLGDGDVVLVDIGHADVVITLFDGARYDAARTVDFGCDEFDRVVAELAGVDVHTASAYKRSNFEGVMDSPEVVALCDRFAMEVSKVLNFYRFSNPDREIGGLVAIGGGAEIPQLVRSIGDAVDLPVEKPGDAACMLAAGTLAEVSSW